MYEIVRLECRRQGFDKQSYYYEDIADLSVIHHEHVTEPQPIQLLTTIMCVLKRFWRKDIRPDEPPTEPSELRQVMLQYWTDCEKKEHWCVFVIRDESEIEKNARKI